MDLNGFESLADDREFGGVNTEALTNQIRNVDQAAEEGCQSVFALIKSAQSLLLLLRSATSPRLSAQPVSEGRTSHPGRSIANRAMMTFNLAAAALRFPLVPSGQPVTAAPPLSASVVKTARAQFNDALARVRKCISGCKSSRIELAKLIDDAGMDIGDDSEQATLEELKQEAAQGNDRLASAISLLRNMLTEMAVLLDNATSATG